DTFRLVRTLIELGYLVSVETNGTIDASPLHREARRIIDIKCPGSGEEGKTHPNNLAYVRSSDEFKFVLADRTDFEYALDFLDRHEILRIGTILFSPVWSILDPALLCEWILSERVSVRINLQFHKYIWPESTRGR
ncbi:7-carboxy-7-deazaguanine synthase, partial [bacterium]|nr:7-carboxy-7-deazaguanine synthase [bacterium]